MRTKDFRLNREWFNVYLLRFSLMAFEHKLPGFFAVRKNFLKIFRKAGTIWGFYTCKGNRGEDLQSNRLTDALYFLFNSYRRSSQCTERKSSSLGTENSARFGPQEPLCAAFVVKASESNRRGGKNLSLERASRAPVRLCRSGANDWAKPKPLF